MLEAQSSGTTGGGPSRDTGNWKFPIGNLTGIRGSGGVEIITKMIKHWTRAQRSHEPGAHNVSIFTDSENADQQGHEQPGMALLQGRGCGPHPLNTL